MIYAIQNFWCDFLWCTEAQLTSNWVFVVERKQADDLEIHIWKWIGWWKIISVPPIWYDVIFNAIPKEYTTKSNIDDVIHKKIAANLNFFWPVSSNYLLYKNNFQFKLETSSVRTLNKYDYDKYVSFMKKCGDSIGNVCFNLDSNEQKFFWLFDWGNLVSVWNYDNDCTHDIIAHIGILTDPTKRGRWYASAVACSMINDIFANWLIPQWRVFDSNVDSLRLAQHLWFTELYKSYSLCPCTIN